ncbi:MAG: lipopolysaccharide biosynthesis protein [Oscillospiraceae bacterium]|nr:lipopolysaccharide biosynthesis protein [Oscillospiraceae bacterium]
MSQTSNIKLKALSGVIWKMAERMGSQLVSIVVGVILARILSPEDYSVVAIVSIFFVFCNVFITGGLNTSLIQKKDTDELDYSTVLFVSLPISILLYLVMFFAAPAIANLYNKEILVPVIRVMSLTLIITAYQGVVSAKISNDLAFKKTFLSSFVSIIISAVIGILMAYKGFGAWALVAQQMSASIIGSATLTIVSKIRFRLAFSVERLKGLFNYGWKMFVASVISVIYDEIKPLIVGLKFSAVDLAYYNKGKGYPQLLNSSICDTVTSVLFPVISKFQENKNDVLNITRRFMSISSYIVFPMLIGFYVLSDSFITVVLTEKWLPISPYIKIFCVSFIFNIVQTANLQAIRAIGRSDVILKLEIIKKTLYFIVIALFIYFSDSPYMLAVSGIVCTLIATIVNTYPNRKLIGYRYRYQFIDLLPNLVIAIMMGTVVYFVNFIRIGLTGKLILQIFVGVIVYIALSIVTKNKNFKYILGIIKVRKNDV